MIPRDIPFNQEENSTGVLWHCQSRGLGGVQPHCQEWCPEGGCWNLQAVRFRQSSNKDRRLRGLVSHAGHKDHKEYRSKENPCDPGTLSVEKTASLYGTETLSSNSLTPQEIPSTLGHDPGLEEPRGPGRASASLPSVGPPLEAGGDIR